MGYDGIAYGNRVDHTTERKLHAKVVDSVLNNPTLWSRFNGMGKTFQGKTQDFTLKITDSALGEFFTGLETLSTAASDTTLQLSYAHTAFAQPVVSIMLESMANTGSARTIPLNAFKLDEAVAEAREVLGAAVYGTGAGDEPNGLEILVDSAGTIGGQARGTYSALASTETASGGTLTLAKLATLEDATSATGVTSELPTLNVTTKTIWSLYEQLLNPTVTANYADIGYNALSVRGDSVLKSRAQLKGAAGFTALTYRGVPVIKDDFATSGVWYMLNENYMGWYGRTIVPEEYKSELTSVSLGTPSTMEGVSNAPSPSHGWFFQKMKMMPNQAGMIGRYYVVGQMCTSQPRRSGKLTGLSGV